MEGSKIVILVDADYIDHVAFDLIVNFERMLGRRIPSADLAHWLDCIALDGGMRPKKYEETAESILCVFVHSKEKKHLDNFRPADFEKELQQQAFRDDIGEFVLQSINDEGLATTKDFFMNCLKALSEDKQVERIMVVGNTEEHAQPICRLTESMTEKDVTLFTMTPLMGCRCKQEILGYSLMSALGIRSEEFDVDH